MFVNAVQGMTYNLKGLKFGLTRPKLLLLGFLRFGILVLVTLAAATVILAKYQEILNLMWHQPQSAWVAWLWHVVSWLLALLLMGVAVLFSFLISQLLFSAVIMDLMSQITERKLTGQVTAPPNMGLVSYFFFIVRQEIPRVFLPVLISLLILLLGWFTPLGPVLTIIAPLTGAVFLAWDNTDLLPARRLISYRQRFVFLRRNLGFHFGFGVLFLIPIVNMVLISFAPVGATLYQLDCAKALTNAENPPVNT
jgi:CysZ protein